MPKHVADNNRINSHFLTRLIIILTVKTETKTNSLTMKPPLSSCEKYRNGAHLTTYNPADCSTLLHRFPLLTV